MKQLNIFLCFAMILISTSCKKDKVTIDDYWGDAKSIKNGEEWSCYPKGGVTDTDRKLFLSMNTYSEEGFHRELLIIYKIPFSVGKYSIKKTSSDIDDDRVGANYFTSVDDGDVTEDVFNILE